MKVVFIGAGNLATQLSFALQKFGMEIVQIYSRTEASAKKLSSLLQTSYTTNIESVIPDAALYFVSVSDDAIVSLMDHLHTNGGLVVHTAGSVPMEVFAKKFANFGVFYPLQTFSKTRFVDFSTIPIFLEANTPENLNILLEVAKGISQNIFVANSQERELIHIAAVFCCNFVNHLYHLSSMVVQQVGFDFNILAPLLIETAQKAISSGKPDKMQTGPAVRKDMNVLQKHADRLSFCPELQAIYKILSDNIGKNADNQKIK